jgi:putative two-component system hydrogenase maturation factor HypX/HoxX
VIALLGGEDFFSNGIDLNRSRRPPVQPASRGTTLSRSTIVREILHTNSHLVVAALRGNAGRVGMLALAADYVRAPRRGA